MFLDYRQPAWKTAGAPALTALLQTEEEAFCRSKWSFKSNTTKEHEVIDPQNRWCQYTHIENMSASLEKHYKWKIFFPMLS